MLKFLTAIALACAFSASSVSAAPTLNSLEKRIIALEKKVKVLDGTKLRKTKTAAARNRMLKGTYRFALMENGGNRQKFGALVRFGIGQGEFTFDGKGNCTITDSLSYYVDQGIVHNANNEVTSTHKVDSKKYVDKCKYSLAGSGKLTIDGQLEFMMSRDLQMGVSTWVDEESISGGLSRISVMATLVRKN